MFSFDVCFIRILSVLTKSYLSQHMNVWNDDDDGTFKFYTSFIHAFVQVNRSIYIELEGLKFYITAVLFYMLTYSRSMFVVLHFRCTAPYKYQRYNVAFRTTHVIGIRLNNSYAFFVFKWSS